MKTKEQILDLATNQFRLLGIRSVSMDDLSSQLGISKKTLYQYVRNKEDLVDQSISRHIFLEKELMEHIRTEAVDAMEDMVNMARHIVSVFREMRPNLVHDLKKYYKSSWKKVVQLHSTFIKERIHNNIERGMEEGYYRININADIISKLYVAKTWSLVDEVSFPLSQYAREELIKQHIHYHLHGILSEKGLKYLDKFNLFN